MSASDLLKSDFDFATGGLFGEMIGYKSIGGLSEAVARWESIPAVVDRTPDFVGVDENWGRSAIAVVISKSYLETVNAGSDRVLVDDRERTVQKVASEDAGGWGIV